MSLRLARTIVALLLAAAGARPAAAFQWIGRAGVDYQRLDQEMTDGSTLTAPRLDVAAALDLSDSMGDLLSWNAGVGYRHLDLSQSNAPREVRNQVDYRLRSSLFNDARSAVRIDLNASRTEDSSGATDSLAATDVLTTTYGAGLALNAVERPYLNASYAYSGTEYDAPTGPVERTLQGVSATTGWGGPSYTYRGSYRLNMSEGTYALDNYDDHRVDVMADAHVSQNARLSVTDTFYRRVPTGDSVAFNPRQELNGFVANLRAYPGLHGDVQSLTYSYSRAVGSSEAMGDVERTQHTLSYAREHQLASSPEWRFRGQLSAAYADAFENDLSTTVGSQSLGGVVYWQRRRSANVFELHGGPTVGVLEPSEGDTQLGYGATAGGFANQAIGSIQTSFAYDATYAKNVDADAGWAISQSASASATGRLGLGSLRATLNLVAQRRDHPLLGTAATRSATLTSSYVYRRSSVDLQAALQDGAAGVVAGFRDGLFLPLGYDTHSRWASLGASTRIWDFLVLRARLRYLVSDLPDRPSTDEKEAFGGIEYVYGALRFALEDRFVVAGTAGGSTRFNQVFVRAYRTFGSNF